MKRILKGSSSQPSLLENYQIRKPKHSIADEREKIQNILPSQKTMMIGKITQSLYNSTKQLDDKKSLNKDQRKKDLLKITLENYVNYLFKPSGNIEEIESTKQLL